MSSQDVKMLIASAAGSFLASLPLFFATRNWELALEVFVALLMAAGLLMTGGRWIARYYAVCRRMGIESSGKKTAEDWDKCFRDSTNVRVLVSRGGAVLGSDTDPMYQNVKNLPKGWSGRIRVLVLNPTSRYLQDRARELDFDVRDVAKQCENVMSNIQRLRETLMVDITGKYYDSKPFLRFTLFDEFGFFSYPAWGKKYIPYAYHFKISNRRGSLYQALAVHFDQLWQPESDGAEVRSVEPVARPIPLAARVKRFLVGTVRGERG